MYKLNAPKINYTQFEQQDIFLNNALNSRQLSNDIDPKQLSNNIIQQKRLVQVEELHQQKLHNYKDLQSKL